MSRTAWAWLAFVVAFGVGANVYLALRPSALEARVRQELGRTFDLSIDFDAIDISWKRGISVGNLSVHTRRGEVRELLNARRVRLLPDFLRLLVGRFRIRELVVEEPELHVARRANGVWNFHDLLSSDDAAVEEPTPVSYTHLTLPTKA